MFVTGPNVVKTVTHEEVTSEDLGGAKAHAEKSGVNHFTSPNDVTVLKEVRDLMTYLPQNWQSLAPHKEKFEFDAKKLETIGSILPENNNMRSEERRVGKECRNRRWRNQ